MTFFERKNILTENERTILELVDRRFSHKEIAIKMGKTKVNIDKKIYTAHLKLRRQNINKRILEA